MALAIGARHRDRPGPNASAIESPPTTAHGYYDSGSFNMICWRVSSFREMYRSRNGTRLKRMGSTYFATWAEVDDLIFGVLPPSSSG
ncbi:MAG TPA: hypothetical protein VKT80_06255, partial [Chloroflexota bacterium]|nr:hypothetical protein [Chloroflexota bacterium]